MQIFGVGAEFGLEDLCPHELDERVAGAVCLVVDDTVAVWVLFGGVWRASWGPVN